MTDPLSTSRQALQEFALDQKEEKKPHSKKLVIEKDSSGQKILRYKEIPFWQAVGAFFGFGNASFSNIASFCKKKELSCAELRTKITSYNKPFRILPQKIINKTTENGIAAIENERIRFLEICFNNNMFSSIAGTYPTPQELYLATPEQLKGLQQWCKDNGYEKLATFCQDKAIVEQVQLRARIRKGEEEAVTAQTSRDTLTAQDARGNTPLHIACLSLRDHQNFMLCDNLVTMLTVHGQQISMQNHEGKTPLHILCEQKDLTGQQQKTFTTVSRSICKSIGRKGIVKTDTQSRTPLFLALQAKNYALANTLLVYLEKQDLASDGKVRDFLVSKEFADDCTKFPEAKAFKDELSKKTS